MGTSGDAAPEARKTTITPKAVIYQKYGSRASYEVEEVQESAQNGCPGLYIPQKGPSLFRCRLNLPELSIVSETFKKKKDAEQAAAEMAIQKFLASQHPLSCHFKAALSREGDLYGSVPVSVIAVYDGKISSLCKLIDPKVESNPCLVISFVLQAAATLPTLITATEGQLWIRRQNPYPPEVIEPLLLEQSCTLGCVCVQALLIPSSLNEDIKPVTLNVSSSAYYLDVIAQKLGLLDASKILVSRPIGKSSSETRLYFVASDLQFVEPSSELNGKKPDIFEGSMNARASYLAGQEVYGGAIMASIGYTWKSKDLFHEDVFLKTYYRMLIYKTPSGPYKLSRESTIATELPVVFTIKSNWRGAFPREILCTFCRQHRLSEPVFTISRYPVKALSDLSGSQKKLKVTELTEGTGHANENAANHGDDENLESMSKFRCEVKVLSKLQDLILQCSPKDSCRKETDCIQNASLKVLSWLSSYFQDFNMPLEKLNSLADALDVKFNPQHLFKEFKFCLAMYLNQQRTIKANNCVDVPQAIGEHENYLLRIEGPESGICPSNGSLACICYSACLVTEVGDTKELIESAYEFEFELGARAVNPHVETAVAQMSVGQSAFFLVDLPSQELILAAANDSARALSLINSNICRLEYCITLLKVSEPLEDRMEQALFSPPLSKQRVEYAVEHIKKSDATTLVDFGCGSGSLLESLLDYPTSLRKIVGVDLSLKSLSRAAKVIEHMEEDQASLFGDLVLSSFRPSVLIVSTPNYEYNVILQKSDLPSQEEAQEGKGQSESCRFRNHDHKFEWTREQFSSWARNLASRHNYSVEFSGVGGSADCEPGFASQIALFKRLPWQEERIEDEELVHPYNIIWEWSNSETSKSCD
ncbi:hypothetical protein EUGRSUZ_K01946 [Eucalyptus grandis]|uniref:Uncharacterized protein n=1 Tax=Eucalyptus grandis TaxID=71139 RepID=A0ACC3KYD8_EUCGR|nr:hypothetical protein EUGRSUZ_K01946 [Eucalyptus grandis]